MEGDQDYYASNKPKSQSWKRGREQDKEEGCGERDRPLHPYCAQRHILWLSAAPSDQTVEYLLWEEEPTLSQESLDADLYGIYAGLGTNGTSTEKTSNISGFAIEMSKSESKLKEYSIQKNFESILQILMFI